MVGAAIRFALDTSEIDGVLKSLATIDQDNAQHEAWSAIGLALVSNTRRRMREGVSPQGVRWPPSKRVIKHGGKTLIDTGRLWNSIVFNVLPNGVEYGSDLIYAAVHQFGWPKKNIPARPYLGLAAEDAALAKRLLAASILKRVEDGRKKKPT